MFHATDAMFVNGLSSIQLGRSLREGQLKRFHRKSRTGCQRCRAKRVKCSEDKPICRSCVRNHAPCIYDRLGQETSPRARSGSEGSIEKGPSTAALLGLADLEGHPDERRGLITECSSEPEETRCRRMLELELMHFYITETGPSMTFDIGSSHDMFVKAIPRMALRSDALLYSIYAFVALHWVRMTKVTTGEKPSTPIPESMSVSLGHHQLYLQLAFQHHRRELENFSRDNVDLLIMTTHFMRVVAFVVLSERSLVPYTPPLAWLRITNSHYQIFRAAWDLVEDDSSTHIVRIIRSTPVVWDWNLSETAVKHQDLENILLAQDQEDNPDFWNAQVRRAYASTLNYIGGIWQAMHKGEPRGPIRRQLILFPTLVEKLFIDLVAEGRPRALVILAHYFALVVDLKSFWFIGDTGAREIRAIAEHLPPRWQSLMDWPLKIINEGLP